MKKIKSLILIIFSLLFVVACSEDSGIGPTDSSGSIAGSYARMLAIGDKLYIIEETDLTIMDITNPESPSKVGTLQVGEDIETIFYNGTNLFIGSQNGLYIYTIANSGLLEFESLTNYEEFGEVRPCDPVVANQSHAFVTLSTSGNIIEGGCSRFIQLNQLRIYDINDITMVTELAVVDMSNPKGLALDGDYLFVCENNDGLKVFDVSDVTAPQLIQHFPAYDAYDAIAYDDLLMVVGPTEIRQYDYTDINNILLLSTIEK